MFSVHYFPDFPAGSFSQKSYPPGPPFFSRRGITSFTIYVKKEHKTENQVVLTIVFICACCRLG
jgi:hypothetical protein